MTHKLRVNSVTPPSPRAPQEWMASCSCGWIGDVVQSIADAEQDYDDHATCDGHPAGPFDPMGETVYCDGTCKEGRQR